jgi:hypothetical protein
VSKKPLTVRSVSQIPAAIRKLWGSPPIRRSDDPDDYWKLAGAIAGNVEPASMIEWIYLKDIVDCTFDIRWLRKCKASLIAPQRTDRDDFVDNLPSFGESRSPAGAHRSAADGIHP